MKKILTDSECPSNPFSEENLSGIVTDINEHVLTVSAGLGARCSEFGGLDTIYHNQMPYKN